jgi:hypothetical protein
MLHARDTVGIDPPTMTDHKDVDLSIPLEMEMEIDNYPMSNLRLLIVGAAFFTLWAGSVRFSERGSILDCR